MVPTSKCQGSRAAPRDDDDVWGAWPSTTASSLHTMRGGLRARGGSKRGLPSIGLLRRVVHSARRFLKKITASAVMTLPQMSALRDATNRGADMAHPAKKARPEPQLSPLLSILDDVGVSYMQHSEQFVLRRAVSSIQVSLSSIMKPQNKGQDFLQLLEQHFTDSENLNAFLMPTNTHDSVCRILLGVLPLQAKITDLLLSKLAQHICDEEEVEQQGTIGSICRLILHQFRWLHARAPQLDLIPKILNLIQAFPASLKRDVIAILPDIADDSDHETIVVALHSIMTDDSSCTIPILDALSILNVPSNLCHDMTSHVVAALASAPPPHLPVIIKFLMQTCDLEKSDRVISAMRKQLSCMDTDGIAGAGDTATLVIDALASGLRFRPEFASKFLSTIGSIASREAILIVDYWVLLILSSFSHTKAAALKVFKHKAVVDVIDPKGLALCIATYNNALKEYCSSILATATMFFQCSETACIKYGEAMFQAVFQSYPGVFRQEVISSIVTHAGSGNASEGTAALNLLKFLTIQDPSAVVPFLPFVKGILDFVDSLSNLHIRILFQALSFIAVCQTDMHASVDDELHICLRKMISSPNFKTKKQGILACVSMACALSMSDTSSLLLPEQVRCLPKLPDARSSEHVKCGISLLQTVLGCCGRLNAKAQEVLPWFYDELSSQISSHRLHILVISYIAEHLVQDFEETYLYDVDDCGLVKLPVVSSRPIGQNPLAPTTSHGLNILLQANLDGDTTSICLALGPMIASSTHEDIRSQASLSASHKLACMCALFKLLQNCEMCREGNIANIDALLGCPVYAHEPVALDQFPSLPVASQIAVCTSLFYTVNWFIETINAFCAYDDADVKSKILLRLHSILSLESRLVECMKLCPFDPAAMCSNTSPLAPRAGPASQVQDKKKSKSASEAVSLKTVRPYFRDLELRTINVCCYSQNLVGEIAFRPEDVLGITPTMLLYLMSNFRRKIDCVFSLASKATSTSASGEAFDSNLPSLFDSFKEIFPYISLHLHSALKLVFDDVASSQDSESNSSSVSIALEVLAIFNKFISFAANHPLSWSSNCRYLLACLAANITWKSLWPPAITIDAIIEHCISTYEAFSPKFGLNCAVAAAIVETLNHVVSTQHNLEQNERVSNIAMLLLETDWNVPAKQKIELLPSIVRHVIRHSKDPAVPLRTFTDALLELSEATVHSAEVQAVCHSTMPIFYQCCIEEQVFLILRLSCRDEGEDTLHGILNSISGFGDLCALCKLWETNKRMHKVCLLFSSKYLDNLLKIMPLLSKRFASNREQIVDILQKMQKGTRILQSLCSHCKATKDVTLINAIPSVKKNLERVIFHVKSILEAHRCLKAFWVGNLKTKNLRGEEISSQPYEEAVSSDSASGAEEDDATPDVAIEDPASDDAGAEAEAEADGAEDTLGSPSFGHDVLEGDMW